MAHSCSVIVGYLWVFPFLIHSLLLLYDTYVTHALTCESTINYDRARTNQQNNLLFNSGI